MTDKISEIRDRLANAGIAKKASNYDTDVSHLLSLVIELQNKLKKSESDQKNSRDFTRLYDEPNIAEAQKNLKLLKSGIVPTNYKEMYLTDVQCLLERLTQAMVRINALEYNKNKDEQAMKLGQKVIEACREFGITTIVRS